jgi:hypothetical protein
MLNTEDFKPIIKEHVKEWEPISNSDIQFVRLSGLTNVIYQVKNGQGTVPPIIFRKFGNT